LALSRKVLAGLLIMAAGAQVCAQAIFTCVDAKGRRLTADRPIKECLDREQKELNPSGTVRRRIGPTLTAAERAAEEEKARAAVEERNRALDEKKRERALLTRYPDRASHDKERAAALELIEGVARTADARTAELQAQRKKLETEVDFYRRNPAKYPDALKRQLEENEQGLAAQRRFTAGQEEEKKRLHARFDEELGQLRKLWAAQAPAAASK
jgi:hypothetical protein